MVRCVCEFGESGSVARLCAGAWYGVVFVSPLRVSSIIALISHRLGAAAAAVRFTFNTGQVLSPLAVLRLGAARPGLNASRFEMSVAMVTGV